MSPLIVFGTVVPQGEENLIVLKKYMMPILKHLTSKQWLNHIKSYPIKFL